MKTGELKTRKPTNGNRRSPLVENHRLVVVNKNSIFEMKSNGVSEDRLFEVAAFANQIRDSVAMVDAVYILMDDRALVQVSGGIMGRRANQFHPAHMSLVVGLAASKGREKGVVNIYYRAGDFGKKLIREHLHVAGHDDKFAAVFLDNFNLLRFRFRLRLLAYRNVVKGELIALGLLLQVRVIGDDTGEIPCHFSGSETKNGIVEAVVGFGYKEGNLGAVGGECDADLHAKLFDGKFSEVFRFVLGRSGGEPFDPLEKDLGCTILVLVGMHDITPAEENPAGDARNKARLVGAVEECDDGLGAHETKVKKKKIGVRSSGYRVAATP